ncbi:MAG: AAA family ATPase [Acidimicrobiales bacterium]
MPVGIGSPADLRDRLADHAYLADDGLAMAVYLALTLSRPLFLEGEPGVGKTEVAKTLAGLIGAPLIRLQCYEGIDAAQALYDWDFPRQLLHLRAVDTATAGDDTALRTVYGRDFLLSRPILAALETVPSVLLIDEVDRADDEFEAFLLEVLSDFSVTIPEIGTVTASQPPIVVITSNRTREVHDALKRRCYYHWLDHPDFAREVAIVRARVPDASQRLAEQVAGVVAGLREAHLYKPPGVAETIDWTEALVALGCQTLDADLATATLGAVLKYREDQERARSFDIGVMIDRAVAGT